jgi:hypothetical protein
MVLAKNQIKWERFAKIGKIKQIRDCLMLCDVDLMWKTGV